MKSFSKQALFALFLVLLTPLVAAESFASKIPRGAIVSTIKPVHSLVEAVLGETGNSLLLVDGSASMHGYQMKPSQQRALSSAKVVFLIDSNAETFLEKAFVASESSGRLLALADDPKMQLLKKRQGDDWQQHDHHEGEAHAVKAHEINGDVHKDHGTDVDLHIWLSPKNALLMVRYIEAELKLAFPEFTEQFTLNANTVSDRLQQLDKKLEQALMPLQSRPFIVFHDAFGYLEKRYSLKGVGSILIDRSLSPSVSQIRSVRNTIESTEAVCVFSEPQFSEKIISVVVEGKDVKSARVDPLGAGIEAGETLYFQLMENLVEGFKSCLGTS